MRMATCIVLLCIAPRTFAQHKVTQDFRGARFNPDQPRFRGPTPDKFMTLEAEGLRLRYTGKDAPPAGDPSAVSWELHARGDFVVTARYEILKCAPPGKAGFAVGPELYMKIDTSNEDGIAFGRCVYANGQAHFIFNIRTNDAGGKRITRDFKSKETSDQSLTGRLRMARVGSKVTASFAEGDNAAFTEFQRAEIGLDDLRLVRFSGIPGGDPKAVLDMRMLEFQMEAAELARDGQFTKPAPKSDGPKVKDDAPAIVQAVPVAPGPEQVEPAGKRTLLILIGILFLLIVPALFAVGAVLLLRRKSAAADESNAAAKKVGGRTKEAIKAPGTKPKPRAD